MNVTLKSTQSPTSTIVSLGGLDVLFSYQTAVAYRDGGAWTVSENIWSNTTGKHITQETGVPREHRIPNSEFVQRLQSALGR